MAKFSKELLNMLSEFMVCEIESKALDGITYTMVLKEGKDKERNLYDRYAKIREEANKCGYTSSEVFRVYEVCNGYIFDMDIATVKKITNQMVKNMENIKDKDRDIINTLPDERRARDIKSMARYLLDEFTVGKEKLEVALFSKNSTNRIIINGKGSSGEHLAITYNAYALRHWDFEEINRNFLIPKGVRVKAIQPCEILPSKTGVSFLVEMEAV
jgi:hypothetical protein